MRTIPAREIKRRGISAVDELLREGVVYVMKNDEPRYVVVDPDLYAELIDGYEEWQTESIRQSLEDVKAGRVRSATPAEIMEKARRQAGLIE